MAQRRPTDALKCRWSHQSVLDALTTAVAENVDQGAFTSRKGRLLPKEAGDSSSCNKTVYVQVSDILSDNAQNFL
jgi:hypothetical protein